MARAWALADGPRTWPHFTNRPLATEVSMTGAIKICRYGHLYGSPYGLPYKALGQTDLGLPIWVCLTAPYTGLLAITMPKNNYDTIE